MPTSSAVPGGASDAPRGDAITTLELSKRYRQTVALASLTMSVKRGQIFGFLGPNGAGKTTSVKLLLGLTRPTSGEAAVLGVPAGNRAARRHIGYLPELFRYQDWLSAREVLALHSALAGILRSERACEIDRVLTTVGLSTRADDRVSTFSKGMQQRLGLGVALLGHPELVFLDEPTSALDPVGRHDVREIIRELRRRGTTVFLNSHLLSEVEQVCDTVAVVDKGSVIASGTLEALLGGSTSVRIRATGLAAGGLVEMGKFGAFDEEAGWITYRGVSEETVPLIVDELVRLGGRIYTVESRHQTLEDRFLQLLGGSCAPAPDDNASHTA